MNKHMVLITYLLKPVKGSLEPRQKRNCLLVEGTE